MIAARQRSGTDRTRHSFDFVLTYERDLIIEGAQALTLRIGLLSAHDG